jgi:hypothetical protein
MAVCQQSSSIAPPVFWLLKDSDLQARANGLALMKTQNRAVDEHETFGRTVGARVPSDQLTESLPRLFTRYETEPSGPETF